MTDGERGGELSRPPWLGRAVVLLFVGLAGFLFLGWLVLRLQTLLIMLLVSLVLSFALEPPVNRLERMGMRRGAATMVTLLTALALGTGFLFVMGQLAAQQAAELIEQGPEYLTSAEAWINDTFDARVDFDELLDEFNEGGRLGQLAQELAPGIVDVGNRVLTIVFQGFTVALFTFYLVADGPQLRRAVCSVFPPQRQHEILRVWEIGIEKTGGYIYSRAVLAVASASVHWVAFEIIGVPSPVVLAIWVGVISQFVPVIGTYLAGILPVSIALVGNPLDALWVLGVVIVYQQVENYLLAPRITAHTMNIHPAVAFGSVIAGGAVLGPIGALLALPVAATGTALVSTYLARHEVIPNRLTTDQRPRRGRADAAAGPADNGEGARPDVGSSPGPPGDERTTTEPTSSEELGAAPGPSEPSPPSTGDVPPRQRAP